MSPWQIKQLGQSVLRGAVFIYPTDTIWGIGCHPQHQDAVQRILVIKQRPVNKGLILLASRLWHLQSYLKNNLNHGEMACLQAITQQPTTWLIETSRHCPGWLRGQFSTIAVRLTDHPFIQQICDAIQAPLVSTSANRSKRTTVRNRIQARRQFGTEVDYIVGGFGTGSGKASTIKSLQTGQIIRGTP